MCEGCPHQFGSDALTATIGPHDDVINLPVHWSGDEQKAIGGTCRIAMNGHELNRGPDGQELASCAKLSIDELPQYFTSGFIREEIRDRNEVDARRCRAGTGRLVNEVKVGVGGIVKFLDAAHPPIISVNRRSVTVFFGMNGNGTTWIDIAPAIGIANSVRDRRRRLAI